MKRHYSSDPARTTDVRSNVWGDDDPALTLDRALRRAILDIPSGKVSTYGGIAAAAGFPRYHRSVARLLRHETNDELPWHRIVGADGMLKTSGIYAKEQRSRLRMEGVKLQGDKVDLDLFLYKSHSTRRKPGTDERD